MAEKTKNSYPPPALINGTSLFDVERMAREKVEDFQNYYQEKVAGANDFASEQADALHEAASEGWTQVTDTGSILNGAINDTVYNKKS